MMKQRMAWVVVICICLFGCSRTESARTGENTLHFDNGGEPEYLDANLINDTTSLHIGVNLFEGLTSFHPRTLEPLPGVAESWTISPDGKTYTFTLRKGVKWTDGKDVTAQDFVYAWRRVLDPKTATRTASNMYPILNAKAFNQGQITDPEKLGFRAESDMTLVVTLEIPLPPFPMMTAHPSFSPARKDIIEAHGDRWTRPETIVSNGPFSLVEWVPNKHIILKKNPSYWDAGNVRLDKIIFTPTEDHSTGVKLFQSRQIDYMEQVPINLVEQFRNQREFMNSKLFAVYYYWLNCKHPILKDVRVRHALSLAINRAVLADQYLKGLKSPAEYWAMPPGVPGFPYVKYVEFNPEKARKLLTEAGYPDPSKIPPLEIAYNTNEDHRLIAEVIQQMLRTNLGINATIRNMEWKVFLKQLQKHQFEIARMGNVGEYVYPIPMMEVFLTGAESNFGEFSNASYDNLWKEAMATADPKLRMAIYGKMEKILADEVPVMPLYYYKQSTLLQSWVRGFYRNILLINPLRWVWITPRDQTRRNWDTVLEYTRIPIPKAA